MASTSSTPVAATGPEQPHRPQPVARRGWRRHREAQLGRWLGRTFESLGNRNYRWFFIGQSVSLIGTWMQSVAQSWLVLQLTGSGTMLGVVVAMQTLPVLLLAAYGGLIVDRVDKRRLLLGTQAVFMVLAVSLGLLTLTHTVALWMVIAIAGCLGLVTSVDNPARQAFVPEMVDDEGLPNAVALNSVITNASRAAGPAIAGVLIVTVGIGECFIFNAFSFLAIIAALVTMRGDQLRPAEVVGHRAGQVVEGLRYVRRTPRLFVPLLMMALIGALSYEFQVVLPVLAQRSFAGNADTYGFLTAAFGIGAAAGGLAVAGRQAPGLRAVVISAGAFGVTLVMAAVAPTLAVELVTLVLVGAVSVAFMSRQQRPPTDQ